MDRQSQSKSSEHATKNEAVDEVKESNNNKDLDWESDEKLEKSHGCSLGDWFVSQTAAVSFEEFA